MFVVTHPFHPLAGKVFTLVTRKLNWGEDRVMYYTDASRLRSMPTSWTNEADDDPFTAASAGRSYFRADDLMELAALLEAHLGSSGEVSSE